MRIRYMDGLTFGVIFLAFGAFQITFAETDEAQGNGPFVQPLEPGGAGLFGAVENTFQGFKVVRAVPKNKANVEALLDLDAKGDIKVDFWIEAGKIHSPVDIMVSPSEFKKLAEFLKKHDIPYTIKNSNLESHVKRENEKHLGTLFSTFSGFDYGRYHNLNEIHQEMNNLASRYSHMAKVFSLGKSYEGRDMKAIKISAKKSSNRKVFFFNCAIHAREWITPATCMYMMNQMLTKYGSDSSVTAMLDKMDWVILPVLNVDGYVYTWTNYRMWRKTRSRNSGSCVGTDPNRNWNYKWGGIGTSTNPCRDTYHGSRAFSEIEVVHVARYLYRNRKNLVGYVDIHAYSQLWMTPWGYTRSYPKHYAEQERVAKIAVNALYNAGYRTSYRYGPSSVIIYATSGGSDDWVYGVLGVQYSYALELRDKGRYGFVLPANQILPTGIETFASFKAMSAAMKI